MGRPKASKLTGKFCLRTDRNPDKNGKYVVYIDYNIGTKHAKVTTDVWVEEKFWDIKNRCVSIRHPQHTRINNQLEKQRREIDDRIYEYTQRGGRLTIDILRQLTQGKSVRGVSSKDDIFSYAKKVISEEYQLGKIGVSVRDNAVSNLNQFRKFLLQKYGEDSLFIGELTVEVMREYAMWRLGNGNTPETINKAITPFIKVARRAGNEKLIDPSIAVSLGELYFKSKRGLGSENEDEDVKYLTEPQMAKFIEIYDKVKYPRTRDYMDMFLFSLNACGMRISDLITLEWASVNLSEGVIKKVLYKSKRVAVIPINDKALEILNQWRVKTGVQRFVFGLLPDDFDLSDEGEAKRMRLNKNRAIVTSLKAVGDKMGLPFNLSMHVARHTFAVWALQRGIDVHKISVLMGHSSVMVTEKVYAKFLPSTLQDEVRDRLNFKFD